MRTTVILDDQLLQQARQRAAEKGRTLSDIINDALRQAFYEPAVKPVESFRMVVFGGLDQVQHEPADFAGQPWAYLRDLLCLLPSWPRRRVLELCPAFWRQTEQEQDTQQRLADNVFRPFCLALAHPHKK